jgi:hypothetical protein
MSPPDRRAPTVTITDPAHPGPASAPEALEALEARRPAAWHPLERVLAAAVALLLLAALNAAAQLREDRHRARQLAGVRLTATLTEGEAVTLTRGVDLSVELLVQADQDIDLDLRSMAVDNGWIVTTIHPTGLLQGTTVILRMRHPVDCRQPIAPPSSLTVDVVASAGERHLAVPVTGSIPDTAPYCGALPAVDSVQVTSTSVADWGPHTVVKLGLVNASTRPVAFVRLTYPGFRFSSREPLPVRLAGRAPGVLVPQELRDQHVTFDVALTECTAAREAILQGASSGNPAVFGIQVDGAGGPGEIGIDVPGLEAFLAADAAAHCR